MLRQLKYVLNSYTDDELKDMDLWVNSNETVKYILVEDDDIVLITEGIKLEINGYVED